MPGSEQYGASLRTRGVNMATYPHIYRTSPGLRQVL